MVAVAGTRRTPAGGPLDDRVKIVMHEIRQPVAAVLALAEAARGAPGASQEVRGYLDRIIEQAQELAGAASSVLFPTALSDAASTTRVDVDVDEVVDSVVDAVRVTWSGTLQRRGMRGARWTTVGTRAALRRCLLDIVDNAVRAAGPDGSVAVSVHPGPDGVRIAVEDDGPGFGNGPRGAGLGLAISRQTLAHMGAELSIGAPPAGGGARVVLALHAPRAAPLGGIRAG